MGTHTVGTHAVGASLVWFKGFSAERAGAGIGRGQSLLLVHAKSGLLFPSDVIKRAQTSKSNLLWLN